MRCSILHCGNFVTRRLGLEWQIPNFLGSKLLPLQQKEQNNKLHFSCYGNSHLLIEADLTNDKHSADSVSKKLSDYLWFFQKFKWCGVKSDQDIVHWSLLIIKSTYSNRPDSLLCKKGSSNNIKFYRKILLKNNVLLWLFKIRVISGVISSTKSESEESEHFFFLWFCLWLVVAYDPVKTRWSKRTS